MVEEFVDYWPRRVFVAPQVELIQAVNNNGTSIQWYINSMCTSIECVHQLNVYSSIPIGGINDSLYERYQREPAYCVMCTLMYDTNPRKNSNENVTLSTGTPMWRRIRRNGGFSVLFFNPFGSDNSSSSFVGPS